MEKKRKENERKEVNLYRSVSKLRFLNKDPRVCCVTPLLPTMSHQAVKKAVKPQSPEKKYNASKKRDEDIRVMKIATKLQEQYYSVASWETNLGVKDMAANKRWQNESARADAALTNAKIKQVRHAKLVELYDRDEKMYEEELNQRGMAFCREKY